MARLFGRQVLTTGSPYNELDNDSGRKSHIGDASKTENPTIFPFALKHLVEKSKEEYRRIFEMGDGVRLRMRSSVSTTTTVDFSEKSQKRTDTVDHGHRPREKNK